MKAYFQHLVVLASLLLPATSSHAIEISQIFDPLDLATALLRPGETGLSITSVDLAGHEDEFSGSSYGTFINNSGTYGIGNGIVLSSGNVLHYGDGPNLSSSSSTNFDSDSVSGPDADLLTSITGISEHYDRTRLTIEFSASSDMLLDFVYVFGSEEFPDFVNSSYNDGFGMILNGINIAFSNGFPSVVDHPDFSPFFGTELNGVIAPGLDPRLSATGNIVAGSNTLTLIIADASDGIYDSTAYISLEALPGEVPGTPILPAFIDENGGFVFPDLEVDSGSTIYLDPDVAIGYSYEVFDGPNFESVVVGPLPGDSDYLISFGDYTELFLAAGEVFYFTDYEAAGVSSFTITGIDPFVMLPPDDPLAFVTGVSFVEDGVGFTVVQTPIAVPVPESSSLALGGIFAACALWYRRKHRLA